MKKFLAMAAALCTMFTLPAAADNAADKGTEAGKDVAIFYTSDVHCGIDQNFGYAGLEEMIKYYKESGYETILVDIGDSVQGEPIGTMTDGESVIELMNDMGYDIAIPGNHEFDYGMDQFFSLVQMADFPYISCNFNMEGELIFDPYIIKEVSGMKIAFVGVTTPMTITESNPARFQDENGRFIYGFLQDESGRELYQAVQNAVDSARNEGADYVIVMGHMGEGADNNPWTYSDVIANTNGIDFFMDGHSHDLDQVVMKNKDGKEVPRSAVGTKLNAIGCLTISAEDGSITPDVYYWKNSAAVPNLMHLKNRMKLEVDKELLVLNRILSAKVAETPVDLVINDPFETDNEGNPIRIVRRAETNLADLCVDSFRDQSGADVAILNGGAIRVPILKGDITLDDVLSVFPFGDTMSVIEVTGQQILDALEWGARLVPSENGGFMQVSGLTYEIHTDIESHCTHDINEMFTGVDGEYRVRNVIVGGEPLDLDKTYSLASIDYLLKDAGNGFTMFKGSKILQDQVMLDNQMLRDYLKKALGGTVGEQYWNPYGEGRIVAIDAEEKSAADEGHAKEKAASEENAAA